MADELKASPQNATLGAIARALRAAQQYTGQYQVDPRIPLLGGTGVDELLSLPGAASLMEDVSYYGPRALIKGGSSIGTFRLDPRVMDVADVAGVVAPLAGVAGRGIERGATAVGNAAVRSITGNPEATGMRVLKEAANMPSLSNAVKPKGGNWLADSVEGLVHPLKTQDIGRDPANRLRDIEASLAQNIEAGIPVDAGVVERERARLAPAIAANRWLDSKLAKYIRNEMGTPEDPIRLQADAFVSRKNELLAQKDAQIAKAVSDMEAARQARGFTPEMMTSSQERIRQLNKERDFIEAQQGLHFDPPEGHMNWRRADNIIESRKQSGYPLEGLAGSEVGRRWELLSDSAIWPLKAERYLQAYTPNSNLVKENPWLLKVPPETVVHDIGDKSVELGFGHLTDELKNAMNPGSGLPEEFLIDPAALEKMSVPDIVKRIDDINAWRTVQKAEIDAARAGNAATAVHREYQFIPGTEEPNARGLKWVELKVPQENGNQLLRQGEYNDPAFDIPQRVQDDFLDQATAEARRAGINDDESDEFMEFVTGRVQALSNDWAKKNKPLVSKELEDALKYEGEQLAHCVGGYCPDVVEGKSRIFSLRDSRGKPHATVEMQRGTSDDGDVMQKINQIKGYKNGPPLKDTVPFVLDYLNSQPNIDLTNHGMGDVRRMGIVDTRTTDMDVLLPEGTPRFMSRDAFNEIANKIGGVENFASGGAVNMAGGGLLRALAEKYGQKALDLGMKEMSPGREKVMKRLQELRERGKFEDAYLHEMKQGAEPMSYDRWLEQKMRQQESEPQPSKQQELFAQGGAVQAEFDPSAIDAVVNKFYEEYHG